jgi:4-aminobutyrate aminotransferase-like enzyme
VLAHESNADLIVDETNTGCGATGTGFWAYTGSQADYVTFGKRTQASGFFKNCDEGVINLGGSEVDVALLSVIKKEMDNVNLIEQSARVGKAAQALVSKAAS